MPKRPPNIAVLGAVRQPARQSATSGRRAFFLQDLPPYLPKAFVAIEDRRFYGRWGVDPVGVFRAIFATPWGAA